MNAPIAPELGLTGALVSLGQWLKAQGYAFVTPTPASHSLVNARPGAEMARDLRGVFGWSRPFAPGWLDATVRDALLAGGLMLPAGQGLVRSGVRFASLGPALFAHSAYPTQEEDAVFFGPDTYRFVQLIEQELAREPLPARPRILDVGCGAGPGGIAARAACNQRGAQLVLADINAKALRFAAANAALAGCDAQVVQGDLFAAAPGPFDLIVANPPYLNDGAERTYRHGGGRFGEALTERIVCEGLPELAPGGRLVLYTGSAVVNGVDSVLEAVRPHLARVGWPWRYREIDPDVFGEELAQPAYSAAERIAAVALVVQRPKEPIRLHMSPAMA